MGYRRIKEGYRYPSHLGSQDLQETSLSLEFMTFQQLNNCLIFFTFFTSYSTPNNITQNPSISTQNLHTITSQANPTRPSRITRKDVQQSHLLASQWQLNRREESRQSVWSLSGKHYLLTFPCSGSVGQCSRSGQCRRRWPMDMMRPLGILWRVSEKARTVFIVMLS